MDKVKILFQKYFKIKEIFPNVIVDGQIDFEMLKSLLGEDINEASERYAFT